MLWVLCPVCTAAQVTGLKDRVPRRTWIAVYAAATRVCTDNIRNLNDISWEHKARNLYPFLKPLGLKAWWILAVNQPRINYVIFPVRTATLQAASPEECYLRQLPHYHSKQPGSHNTLSFGIFLGVLKNRKQMTSWGCVCMPSMNRERRIIITSRVSISETSRLSEVLVNAPHIWETKTEWTSVFFCCVIFHGAAEVSCNTSWRITEKLSQKSFHIL